VEVSSAELEMAGLMCQSSGGAMSMSLTANFIEGVRTSLLYNSLLPTSNGQYELTFLMREDGGLDLGTNKRQDNNDEKH
jgi:hypothetical protein